MFGRHPNLPVDFLLGTSVGTIDKDWVSLHKKRLHKAYKQARDNLKQDQKKRKQLYDQKSKNWNLNIGENVYVKDHSVIG